MINTDTLTDKDKSRVVIYTGPKGKTESGLITSWNDTFIFVRYGLGTSGVATMPENLHFEFEFDQKP